MIRYLWEYHYNSIGTFDRFLKFDVDLTLSCLDYFLRISVISFIAFDTSAVAQFVYLNNYIDTQGKAL